jgi:translation initiation factor IF-3
LCICEFGCPAFQRGVEISSRDVRLNQEIRAREIRLIDEAGKQLGIYPLREAQQIAEERGVDLVEVAPNANPPVCRLMDYGKFLYERTKKEREARRSQKLTEVKEVRLRPKIGEHDVGFKVRRMRQFLGSGAKVKVRVRFRGREITHPEVARELLERIAGALSDLAVVEQAPQMEGNTMLMLLAPAGAK